MNTHESLKQISWVHLEEPAASGDSPKRTARLTDRQESPRKSDQPIVRKEEDVILTAIFSALGVDQNFLNRSESIESSFPPPFRSDNYGDDKPWILHVDDDIEFSNAMRIRLEAYGISVAQARTGQSGIRQAFTVPASAIILDFDMPYGDGRYVLQQLKACEATKEIPVIILTGYRSLDLKQDLLSLGAANFLSKPIDLNTMLATLNLHVKLQSPRGKACLLP